MEWKKIVNEVLIALAFKPNPNSPRIKKDLEFLQDNYGKGFTDYSYLTPEEARQVLRNARRDNEHLSNQDYWGLQEVVASENDEKFLQEINTKNPEEVYLWFKKNRLLKIRMTSNLWKEVGKRIAPIHESLLLKELSNIKDKDVIDWVKNKKKEGYFFSDKVYEKAKQKIISF